MAKYKPIISLTMLFFVSCSDVKKEPEKDEYEIKYEKQNQLDTLNEKETAKLSTHYNAVTGWDTTEQFTYSLQETFQRSHQPISFVGTINDIVKKDSSYILQVYSNSYKAYKNYNAEIFVSPSMFNKFQQILKEKKANEGCFIFEVKNISLSNPVLNSEVDPEGDNIEDASSHITLDFDEALITFRGTLVDYFLYDQLKNGE
jgi:hypothetical protein